MLRVVGQVRDAHGTPEAALKRTGPVKGRSGCVTWLLADRRPWLHAVADELVAEV